MSTHDDEPLTPAEATALDAALREQRPEAVTCDPAEIAALWHIVEMDARASMVNAGSIVGCIVIIAAQEWWDVPAAFLVLALVALGAIVVNLVLPVVSLARYGRRAPDEEATP